MPQRKSGFRPVAIIDTLDVDILNIIRAKGQTIGELSERLEVQHKTLSPHLKKLVELKIIIPNKIKNSRRVVYTLPASAEYMKMFVDILNKTSKLAKKLESKQ